MAQLTPPHVQRMIEEYKEHNIRLTNLDNFIETNPLFDVTEEAKRELLLKQRDNMREFTAILGERLKLEGVTV